MFHADSAHSGVGTDNLTVSDSLLWSYTTYGQVWSSPAVVGNIVYIGSTDHNVYALNASTGSKIWNYTTGYYIVTSPAVANGIVYIGSEDDQIYALNASSGAWIWNYTTGDQINTSPTVVNGIVYFGSDDANVYALNASSGAYIWNFTTGKSLGSSSPAVVGGVVYIGSEDHNIYALNALTGTQIWNFTTGNATFSSPAVINGVVYVGDYDQHVYALNASTGLEIWNFTTGNQVNASPAVSGGVVYVGSLDNNTYALNAASGTQIWNYTTGNEVGSSAAIVNGVVYVGSHDDSFYALNATTGSKLWSYATGGEIRSSPAVVGGVAYFGSLDDNVYAIGTSNSSNSSSSPSPSPSPSSSPSSSPSPNLSNSLTAFQSALSSALSSVYSSLTRNVWVPSQKTSAAYAVAASAVVLGSVSVLFSLLSNPLGGAGGAAGEKLNGLIPNNIKQWLEDFISSKHKLGVEEKKGFIFRPTGTEILAYAISIVALTISFSYVKVASIDQILQVLPVFFATSILVGFAQKFFSIVYMRSKGVWSEHKIWPLGLAMFLVTTFVFKVPFSAPTKSEHKEDERAEKLGAIASASEILISLAFGCIFFVLLILGYGGIGGAGLTMCVIGSFFGTLPITPMSGKDIFDHKKSLWATLFVVTLIIFVAWLFLL